MAAATVIFHSFIFISHFSFLITHLRKHNACAPRMIARGGILLLIGCLVLLIDDDEAQTLEGQEDGRAGTENDIVGILRQLLLPYLHPFGIGVAGVVDTQSVAEDTLQALHHLHRQRNFRQQVEHLFLAFQSPLYEVDIYLRLATAGHAVQEGDRLLHHRHQDGVIGLLLCPAQPLDEFRVILAPVVQSSHLHLVGLQHATPFQLLQRSGRGLTGIQQLLTGNLLNK